MVQNKDAPVPDRRSTSSEYSVSTDTLDAMNSVDLSTPAKSAPDGSPPNVSMAKRKPRPGDTPVKNLIQPTRLRSNVRTTPNASRAMKDAHERRAQQTPENGIGNDMDSLSDLTPIGDGDPMDPFSSPTTAMSMFESEEIGMAPSSPSVQGQQHPMDFIFPHTNNLSIYAGSSSEFSDPNLFTGFFQESRSDSGASGTYEQHWNREPPVGLPSRHMLPPTPAYATKPQPAAYGQRLQPVHSQRYSSREPQPFAYGMVGPSYEQQGYQYHADYPSHPLGGLRGPLKSPANGMMALPSMSDPQLTWDGRHAPLPSPSLGQPIMSITPPTPLDKEKRRAVREGKQRALPEGEDEPSYLIPQHVTSSPAPTQPQDVEMTGPSSTSEADDGAMSGRWKDTTAAASVELYKAMDDLAHAFCREHRTNFSRTIKGYSKLHNIKVPGGNMWNMYCQMHGHRDYTVDELDRVQMTKSNFDLLSADEQQRVRSRCWAAFQKSFSCKDDCYIALGFFKYVLAFEEKDHGITIARRTKLFNATANSFAHAVCTIFSSTFITSA